MRLAGHRHTQEANGGEVTPTDAGEGQATPIDRAVLPIADPTFSGAANRTLAGSQPDWGVSTPLKAPEAAPNVLLAD